MAQSHSDTSAINALPNPNAITIDATHAMDFETSPAASIASSEVSSPSESESQIYPQRPSSGRRSRLERPSLAHRQHSSSIIVPKGSELVQREKPNYPPHDARGMSPRRSGVDLQKLEQGARRSLQDQARILQSSLAALAERIDEVRLDHDKLESENKFLQDYIGGLTRSMSGAALGRSGSSAKRGKK